MAATSPSHPYMKKAVESLGRMRRNWDLRGCQTVRGWSVKAGALEKQSGNFPELYKIPLREVKIHVLTKTHTPGGRCLVHLTSRVKVPSPGSTSHATNPRRCQVMTQAAGSLSPRGLGGLSSWLPASA